MITFFIEFWNPSKRKYEKGWSGHSPEMAYKMFAKPYNQIHTRRLIIRDERIIAKDKAK